MAATGSGSAHFIVLEGIDGSGKSTQLELLNHALAERSVEVVTAREPGGTEVGDRVRDIMLGGAGAHMSPLTWALLMNASRAELVSQVLRPALARGAVVLLDRYHYSTLAYQAHGDGIAVEVAVRLADISTQGLAPDLVVLLDLPAEASLARRRKAGTNVMDERPLDFHRRVRDAYREMAQEDPGPWRVIDASRAESEVHEAILGLVWPLVTGDGLPSGAEVANAR